MAKRTHNTDADDVGHNAPAAEWLPLDALVPHPRNPRVHGDEVTKLARTILRTAWGAPIVAQWRQSGRHRVIAGHGRLLAAREILRGVEVDGELRGGAEHRFDPSAPGPALLPVRVVRVSDAEADAMTLADNARSIQGEDNAELIVEMAAQFGRDAAVMADIGFDGVALDALVKSAGDVLLGGAGAGDDIERHEVIGDDVRERIEVEEDEAPVDRAEELRAKWNTAAGQLWEIPSATVAGGVHRILCGDSTRAEDVARVMAGEKAALIHADPPYGMGKEADGVENDNLYREKLDAFQMAWWRAVRPHAEDNASAYIWGNAADLWRLWYRGGLADSERLEMRNEIVWDKGSAPGMASEAGTQYVTTSERCLFFQFGNQFLGNINADDFPPEWEPLRSYLAGEAGAAGLTPSDVKRVCGCGMFAHWFSRSQFTLIPEKHYTSLAAEYPGHFRRAWGSLYAEWGRVRGMRSYFDNAHSTMRDVWEFPRVVGDDRYGHATPKPVAAMARAIVSSSPRGGVVVEPFSGSGTTLVAAEQTGRLCRAIELAPKYVAVALERLSALGLTPRLVS